MKHITYSFFIGLLSLGLIISSCTPNIVDEFEPIDERWESVEDFTSSLNSEKKVSIPNAEKEFVIKTELATYHFQELSIIDQNGTIVQGPIEMTYTELNSPGDFLEAGLDSEGLGGETLIQYFTAHLGFKQANQILKIDGLKPVAVYLEASNNALYNQEAFTWLNNNGTIHGWNATTSPSLESKIWNFNVNGQNYQGSGFKLNVYEAGWITMADFEFLLHVNDSDFGTLTLDLADKYHNTKTRVYAIHKDRMSVIPVENISGVFMHNQILIGEEVRLIAISVIDEKMHFGRKNIIVGPTNDYSINLSEITYVELIEQMKRL